MSTLPAVPSIRPKALVLACALACAFASSPVFAQSGEPAGALKRYDISAGALPKALVEFAEGAGAVLSFSASDLGSRQAAGLHGEYSIQGGFDALLAGSGWQAHRNSDGSYVLSRAPATAAVPTQAATGATSAKPAETTNLAAVHVTADSKDATTAGTGSYTTRAVTLGKSEHALRDIPQSVSVLTRQRLDDQNIHDISEAMAQTTGVTTQVNNNPYLNNQYFARGYALSTELDGVPSTGSLNVGAPQFDLAMYDRIEVIRGSAGLLEGSGEPGGLVNFARKRPTADAEVSGSLSLGSWNDRHLDLDVGGPLTASGDLRGRAVVAGTDQDQSYGDSSRRSDMVYGILEYDLGPSTLLSLSGTVQRDGSRGILSAIPAYSTGELLELSAHDNPYPGWSNTNQTTREGFAELNHYFDNGWRTRASLRYRTSQNDAEYVGTYGGIDPATNETNYFPAADHTTFKWAAADINASGPFDLFGRTHQLLFGVNYDRLKSQDEYSNLAGGVIDFFDLVNLPKPDFPLVGNYQVRTVQYGAYGQARFSISDPLNVIVGGRVSHFQQYVGIGDFGTQPSMPESPGGVDHKFTPYAGVTYDVSKAVTLYTSYSQIFVPQAQLTASGTPLPPREGKQFEIGAKGSFMDGKLNASVAAFQLNDRNRAYYSSDIFFYSAAGEVTIKGVETEIAGSPLPGWDITAGYTYLDPQFRTDQDEANLSAVTPKHNAKLWSNYHFQGSALKNFNVGVGVLASSSFRSGNVSVPGYATVAAQLGYRIDPHWSMSIDLRNLLDHKYYQTFGGSGGYYGEPRAVMFTVRARY
ncbi:TonB-dependent siderophore receptor [Dyella sp. 20L07]|uniref:TonB-dependent siderophore receptor n=1 Tax=Dyella sp. 20L07 TaxID=3384240 RepID=UPI003D289AA4